MRLRIQPSDAVKDRPPARRLTGSNFTYELEDRDGSVINATNSLTQIELKMGLREATVARITFRLDDVDIDAAALVELQAHLEATKQGADVDITAFEDQEPRHIPGEEDTVDEHDGQEVSDHPERTEAREDGEPDA